MKKIISVLMLLTVFITLLPNLADASTSSELAIENAVELPRNDSTNFSMPEKNDLTDIVDASDSRAYKISLGMNPTEKLTIITEKTFDIEITDANGITLVQRSGVGTEGNRQVEFPTSEVGDYFIYITPSEDGRNLYPYSLRVIVGEPIYHYSNSYRVNLSTSTLTSSKTTSAIQSFDLSNVSTIPNDAIVTGFTIGGTEVNRSLLSLYSIKRSLRPTSSFSWIDATFSLYKRDQLDYVPKSNQIRLKQSFSFKQSATFLSSGTYTLTPYVSLSYKRELK
ncbi:hypothetical protein ACNRWW_19715 [Metabacillus sp. HB246100]